MNLYGGAVTGGSAANTTSHMDSIAASTSYGTTYGQIGSPEATLRSTTQIKNESTAFPSYASYQVCFIVCLWFFLAGILIKMELCSNTMHTIGAAQKLKV